MLTKIITRSLVIWWPIIKSIVNYQFQSVVTNIWISSVGLLSDKRTNLVSQWSYVIVLICPSSHKWQWCTRCANKKQSLEKILYLRNCSRFIHQIYAVYRGGFRPYIQQMAFKYFVWFQNYNYLNLKVHFSK